MCILTLASFLGPRIDCRIGVGSNSDQRGKRVICRSNQERFGLSLTEIYPAWSCCSCLGLWPLRWPACWGWRAKEKLEGLITVRPEKMSNLAGAVDFCLWKTVAILISLCLVFLLVARRLTLSGPSLTSSCPCFLILRAMEFCQMSQYDNKDRRHFCHIVWSTLYRRGDSPCTHKTLSTEFRTTSSQTQHLLLGL